MLIPCGSLCTTSVSHLIEDLQHTLGEGPCVDAYHQNQAVAEPDLAEPVASRWLAFTPRRSPQEGEPSSGTRYGSEVDLAEAFSRLRSYARSNNLRLTEVAPAVDGILDPRAWRPPAT
jgi:hypothetical protein